MPTTLRIAIRSLGRTPGFTAVVVLTLALGIGAITAIFSVVNAVLINPLPYPTADRLQMVWITNPAQGIDKDVTSYPNFTDLQAQAKSFEAMAAISGANFTLTGSGEPHLAAGERVTAQYFDLFGVPAMLGRTIQPGDTQPGRDRVLVLSHRLWQEYFGGDRQIVGKSVQVNAEPHEIVGVMPPEFSFAQTADAWSALAFGGPFDRYMQSRSTLWLDMVGLLKQGVGADSAQSEMSGIMSGLATAYPDSNVGMGILLQPLHETLVGDVRPTLLLLASAVALVLLIVCANVAGLLVARLSARRREIAVRVAIGAGRGHLIRQLLVEAFVLGAAGVAAGVGLADWGLGALLAARPESLPRAAEIALDAETLLFACAIGIISSLAFALLPAVGILRRDPASNLQDDARGSVGGGGARLRRGLVVAEIAVACVLVTGAGLLARSFIAMQSVDPGFERERLLTMRLTLPTARYREAPDRIAFWQRLIERLESLPQVERAGIMNSLVLFRLPGSASMRIEGGPSLPPGTLNEPVTIDTVSTGTFEALGVPLTRGRAFDSGDRVDSREVVIVNEALVRRFYPDQDPIGKRITFSDFGSPDPRWLTIVGVVADTRRSGFASRIREETYFPLTQSGPTSMYVFIRTRTAPENVVAAARSAVWSIDPQLPISAQRTISQVLARSVAEERFRMVLVAGFAITAMLLAAIGVYGLMAFATTARIREFAVRLALGATPRSVLLTVMRDGFLLAAMGLALGLGGAVLAARAMRQMLFGIGPFDPIAFAGMALLLVVVVAVATFLPARRATRVDPMTALRN